MLENFFILFTVGFLLMAFWVIIRYFLPLRLLVYVIKYVGPIMFFILVVVAILATFLRGGK